ncbi:unnamed protein product, partial [marine sediment metagenome]
STLSLLPGSLSPAALYNRQYQCRQNNYDYHGEWIVLSEEKTVDLEAIEEEQRIKQEEYADKGKLVRWDNGRPVHEPWSKFGGEKAKLDHIDLEVRKSLLPYKKFKDERAMTGAKERVIKALIAIKDNYTDAELSKPFA